MKRRRAPTYTLLACWGWDTVKGQSGVLIQTARWMEGSPSYFLSCLVRSLDVTFPSTNLVKSSSSEQSGSLLGKWRAPGSEAVRGGGMQCQLSLKCHKLFFQEAGRLLLKMAHTNTHWVVHRLYREFSKLLSFTAAALLCKQHLQSVIQDSRPYHQTHRYLSRTVS